MKKKIFPAKAGNPRRWGHHRLDDLAANLAAGAMRGRSLLAMVEGYLDRKPGSVGADEVRKTLADLEHVLSVLHKEIFGGAFDAPGPRHGGLGGWHRHQFWCDADAYPLLRWRILRLLLQVAQDWGLMYREERYKNPFKGAA